MEDWLEEVLKAILGPVLEIIGEIFSSVFEGSEWLLRHLFRGILHLLKAILESIATPPLHPTDPTSKSPPDEQSPRKQRKKQDAMLDHPSSSRPGPNKKRRHAHRKPHHRQRA